jgi:transcription elongation factor GreA
MENHESGGKVMAESKYKMSRERYEELQKELEYMQTVREKEVSEQIKEARSYGDLSENSEYDEAKEEQGKLYSKIAEYKNLLENAEIVEKSARGEGLIGIGSKVRVLDLEFNEEDEYQIVGSQEANPTSKRISDDSPFGRGLIGHRTGETVIVEAPAGDLKFQILDVTF